MTSGADLQSTLGTGEASEQALAGRLDALRALNAELEDRIAARTRELGAVSSRLETMIQEVLPLGVVVVGPTGEVELANRPARELMGVDDEELAAAVEQGSWRMFGSDGRELEPSERPIARALQGVATVGERYGVERSDGTLLFLELSAVPTRSPEDLVSVLVTFQDVTKREQLERAERDFVTNAAHELQTPLAAITSAVEVLQSGAKERPEDRDRFLQHIAHACGRLDRLTRALLLLARAQTGEQARAEVVAVEPLVRDVATSLASTREIRIACEPDIAVIANRSLLEQALVSLVENAVKHSDGPVVGVVQPASQHVKIVVRDYGAGISDVDRERVFERFYRGAESTPHGSGLGLAIVASVARALDGQLELESSTSGTSVAIVLPAARIVSR